MDKNRDVKNEMTIDDLARIVQEGFLGVDKRFDKVEFDISEIKTNVKEIKENMDNTEANLNKKVDKVEHNTLIYRVEKLEKKFA
jgi:hypothetical protein